VAKQRIDSEDRVLERVDYTWDGAVLAEQVHTGADATARVTTWDWRPGTYRPVAQTDRVPARRPSVDDVADAPSHSEAWIDEQFHAIVTDLAGTPTELVDAGGRIGWRSRTSLWGAHRGETDAGGAVTCPLRFPGQVADPETGLHYNYHRHYDPDSGRYVSPDPIGLLGGPDPHAYVPNPLQWIDPLGLAPCSVADKARGLLGSPDDVVVLGRLDDTAVAKGWEGHVVLDTPDWSMDLNDAFIREGISQERTFYLASPTKGNLIQTSGRYAGQPTVFARELQMLREAGYTRVGSYMRPPP
jgi:RHS repeat-associated protein